MGILVKPCPVLTAGASPSPGDILTSVQRPLVTPATSRPEELVELMGMMSRAVNTRLESIEKERDVSGSQESALLEDDDPVLPRQELLPVPPAVRVFCK